MMFLTEVLTMSMIVFAFSTTWKCLAMENSCKWLYDVLEMVSEPEIEYRLHYNLVHPGRSFFLRSRISCENQVIINNLKICN